MPKAKITEIDSDGSISSKRKFDAGDWSYISEYVIDEYNKRKNKRTDREKQWKEVDRQIAMEPDIAFKRGPDGKIDLDKMWMAEMELPLQAQALEVLTADARRMMFASSWFRAHAELTDKYLGKVDFKAIIKGDEAEVPSAINQDNADKLVEGFLTHYFRQNDFFTRYDRINAEAFKYGMGVGRARMETKNVYIHEARGVVKETQKIPVLVPVSIKKLYLDEPLPSMHSAQVLGESHIAEDWIKLENLQIAANKGSTDPNDHDGGWMPKSLKGIESDKDGYVQILEMEGDIVVPRKTTRSVVIPGAIVTVAIGGANKEGKVSHGVIRMRFRKYPFSSYLLHPYHYEDVTEPYPTSPLMKGRTVQIMAVGALNRLMDSAALKNSPPVGWDRSDQFFAQNGGPKIHPYAQWGTSDPNSIKVHHDIGGEPGALANVFSMAVNLYAELTGVLPARLGAQTVSHTTAFAKDAELQRGAVRTVDYVNSTGEGPITRWLDMAYRMGRDALGSRETISFYIDAYGGYVEVSKDHLPEQANFEWFGAGGPAEERQKKKDRMEAANLGVQLDNVNVQLGGKRTIKMPALIEQIFREGGWTDTDQFIDAGTSTAIPTDPGAATLAVQNLSQGIEP